MADPLATSAQILALLRSVPDRVAHDGFVPEKLPQTGSYVDPYTVLWAGVGADPDELTSDGIQDASTLVYDFQTTAVGPTAETCRAVAVADRGALLNKRVGRGIIRTNPDGFNQQAPILDTQTTPARFMLPQQWRLITN
ncbi:hypothetical protein [Pseudarthrobacter sp. MEB009]|uniref:hypothetical protein n=1 Tax=Pseudarthrobacter sp. MEB009 TaxID=3040326 RepID=UPI002556C82E|nr:hypothetical protein [Pseudarthrobacter sp. MEB009]